MFKWVLRLLAVSCLVPAILHGALGVGSDGLIGAPVLPMVDATLDSQNRFYGVAFGICGALLLYCASDVARFAGILRIVFAGIFGAGCARFLAYFAHGLPSEEVQFLWATEVLIPPLLSLWLNRHLARSGPFIGSRN
jgi:Domain of unknown function (DUF4345)